VGAETEEASEAKSDLTNGMTSKALLERHFINILPFLPQHRPIKPAVAASLPISLR